MCFSSVKGPDDDCFRSDGTCKPRRARSLGNRLFCYKRYGILFFIEIFHGGFLQSVFLFIFKNIFGFLNRCLFMVMPRNALLRPPDDYAARRFFRGSSRWRPSECRREQTRKPPAVFHHLGPSGHNHRYGQPLTTLSKSSHQYVLTTFAPNSAAIRQHNPKYLESLFSISFPTAVTAITGMP